MKPKNMGIWKPILDLIWSRQISSVFQNSVLGRFSIHAAIFGRSATVSKTLFIFGKWSPIGNLANIVNKSHMGRTAKSRKVGSCNKPETLLKISLYPVVYLCQWFSNFMRSRTTWCFFNVWVYTPGFRRT